MKTVGLLVASFLLAFSGVTAFGASAFAADSDGASDGPPAKKHFDFEGDVISTDFLKPGTLLITGTTRLDRSSLIDVRLDFVTEILRSADNI